MTTATSRTAGQASAAATVSCANARASPGRSPSPGGVGEPALGPRQGLQRYDQGPAARGAPSLSSSAPIVAVQPRATARRARAGAYGVLDRPAAWGDTCAAASRPQQCGSQRKVSECPAAESASGTAWRRSSCKPPLVVLFKRDWRGMEHIPADGGFITAVNHNSYLDPLSYAHFQYNTGRVPRFLAKAALFKCRVRRHRCSAAPARSPSTASPPTPPAPSGPPSSAIERGRMRRVLPRGHPHPRPRPCGR